MSEQQATPDVKVIDRIRKLMALAANNTNEHEAALAAAKVQELLADYNLTMAALDASGQASEGRKKDTVIGKAMYAWQRDLMAAIARANFCYHAVVDRRVPHAYKDKMITSKSHMLVGRESNVASAMVMFEYLLEVIAKNVPIGSAAENLSRSAVSWREGCAYRLVQRLDEKKADMERASREARAKAQHPASAAQQGGTANALVLADVYSSEHDLNADFRYGREPGTTARKRAERVALAGAGADVQYSDAWWDAQARLEAEKEAARRAALTPKQREAEDAKKAREAAREQARRENAYNAHWSKRDVGAFRAGMHKGGEINLDQQIDQQTQRKIGGRNGDE